METNAITITFATSGSDFDFDQDEAIATHLERIAQKMRTRGAHDMGILDLNGNRIGEVTVFGPGILTRR